MASTPPPSRKSGSSGAAGKPAGPSRPSGSGAARAGRAPRKPSMVRVEETSAGGLVLRMHAGGAEAALIGRLDRRRRLVWSMPKGHVEEGETAEMAAVREAAEETGIISRVVAPLGVIDFWFVAEGRRIHKTVHHFLLEATGGALSDEDIEVEEVAWVPIEELPSRLGYADERRLLSRVPDLLGTAGFTVDASALLSTRPTPRGGSAGVGGA